MSFQEETKADAIAPDGLQKTEVNAEMFKGVTTGDNTEVRNVNLVNVLKFYIINKRLSDFGKRIMISAISVPNEGEIRPEWQKWRENRGFNEGENTLANDGLWWPSPMPGFSGTRGTAREGIGI